jgi:alginate O-acetyltransferase complex protein AlgI
MLFNSYIFIFAFLPLTFGLYFLLLRKRLVIGAKGFLVFASLFFYSWWNVAYLPLILFSMLFNYVVGNSLNDNLTKFKLHKKTLLAIGVVCNLALLGYFKYADFFISNANYVLTSDFPLLNLVLPLAISFFTFQQIAYLVDSYRAETSEYGFLNYALFVTFFPQLIAGPIVHHAEMMPQFGSRWNLTLRYKNISLGLFIFSLGLFKKVVIADSFAVWANHGFDELEQLSFIEAWATSLSYSFQLYFDFSGYTDMAIGAALLFNIKLPINFNSPYKALDIQDFWQRWHMTLSRFMREYIYIPLGGNRKGSERTYFNLMATFVLGGIWHGAGWTFIAWGFLHGIALVVNRVWQEIGIKMPVFLAWFITFNFVNIAWIFFRAKDWSDAIKVLVGMFLTMPILSPGIDRLLLEDSVAKFVFFTMAAFFISLCLKNSMELRGRFKANARYLMATLVLALVGLYFLHLPTEFLYFNF